MTELNKTNKKGIVLKNAKIHVTVVEDWGNLVIGKPSHSNAEKPISLKPLKFDEAVSASSKVKTDGKETKLK